MKKSYYSFFSSMSSLFTKLDSCIFFFFSFLKSWWSYSNLNGYFKEIVARKNILSWWLIVENIPRILILALGIKFEFSRLFANALNISPTNMNYREKIEKISRIMKNEFIERILCCCFFFFQRTNAVVASISTMKYFKVQA